MNDVTSAWLLPMQQETVDRGWGPEEVLPLMMQCMVPVAEAGNPLLDETCGLVDDESGVQVAAMDWALYGELLRHELGWCHTYPEHPSSSR